MPPSLLLAAALSFDPALCRPETPAETPLYSSDFRWDYSLPELVRRFTEVYPLPKRLRKRAYWSAERRRFELPYLEERGGVVLPESFVAAVARHAESAFASDYVDAVFFPDMGHSHFLIPAAVWEEKFAGVERMADLYEGMMREPALEVLYHTAEQLKTVSDDGTPVADPRTQWRHRTRNIVGTNDGGAGLKVLQNPASRANTVGEVPGYRWWGGGFNISANGNGCFAFHAKGRTVRFDLSLYDLEPPPGSPIGDYSSSRENGAPRLSGPRFGECESLARERRQR